MFNNELLKIFVNVRFKDSPFVGNKLRHFFQFWRSNIYIWPLVIRKESEQFVLLIVLQLLDPVLHFAQSLVILNGKGINTYGPSFNVLQILKQFFSQGCLFFLIRRKSWLFCSCNTDQAFPSLILVFFKLLHLFSLLHGKSLSFLVLELSFLLDGFLLSSHRLFHFPLFADGCESSSLLLGPLEFFLHFTKLLFREILLGGTLECIFDFSDGLIIFYFLCIKFCFLLSLSSIS